MNKETLTVTKKAVLEAAKVCSQAEKVLKTLFPTAFDPDFYECAVGQRFKVSSASTTYDAVLVQHGPGMFNLIDTTDWNRLFDGLCIKTNKADASICLVPTTHTGSCGLYVIKKID